MLDFLIEMLQCPSCGGDLDWDVNERDGERIERAEARCRACGVSYPVQEGIGIFLTPELQRNDLWEQVGSGLSQHLQENPEIERRLMGASLETLSPADQFFRALVLEERGAFERAKAIFEAVGAGLYTPEYLICQESQFHYLIEHLKKSKGPIVDLASGRCELVQEISLNVDQPVVATDFSPRVLRRDRRWLEYFDLYADVSLLAFDARRTPFKDGAVRTMTTNLGLANIEKPGVLLRELRRVVAGNFWAISIFYPEDESANVEAIDELGLSSFLFRSKAQKNFEAAGWKLLELNICEGRALPTPEGELLEGVRVDNLPVAETMVEFCTLKAN